MKGKMSLEGYKLSKWFTGNWKTIKEAIKVGGPYILGYVTTHNPYWAGIISLAGKFLLDLGEYYYKERN